MPRKSAKPDGPVVVQKMPLNVYTMMLVIAFMCITVACVLLWQELKQWGDGPVWWKATGHITSSSEMARSFPLDQASTDIKPFNIG
ncbi:MAG: hypothetical protein GY917_16425 [Planctomycetaceae bacterium]|nr:hypothetical protein [Planctomycetaceae bacterium]MCP4811933.1 hypothetical protein [Planctomycetaceae bacterium]MEC9004011.1 hypothetical protein [Planctomycetota bacterium]